MSLLASLAALAVAVSPAAAELKEEHFCWETTIAPTSGCLNGGTAGSHWTVEIKVHSTNTAVCVSSQFGQQCGAAGTWLTINTRSGGAPTVQAPSIWNNNAAKSTVVKGIIISEPPPSPPPPPPPPTKSWHYQEVGGEFVGRPAVARTGSTDASIFVEGLDGNLWQNWTTGIGWSGWHNISAITGGPITGGPSATSTGGNVAVVAKQPGNTVGYWSAVSSWGYSGIGGGEILGDPAVAIQHVFVRGLDGNLWQKWWTGSYWTEWQNLSALVGGPIASSPSAVSAAGGKLTVVARMPDNHVGVWSWNGSSWTWQELAGEVEGDPGIASGAENTVAVFAQGLDGNLWVTSTPGIGWYGWEQLTSTPIKSSPAAAGWSYGEHAGEFDVVARSAANQVGVWWYGP
jgi:hypothetical protein